MLVEAVWVAVKTPGPLRAFFERVRSRRGMQIAVVATARKLACLCWTMIERGEDYAFACPSLTEKKLRALELRAGTPSRSGQKGKAAAYSLKEVRRRERELAEQAERSYRQLVTDWQANAPAKKSRVAATNGTRRSRPSTGQVARQASVPEPALRTGVDHAQTQAVPLRLRRRMAAGGKKWPHIRKHRWPLTSTCSAGGVRPRSVRFVNLEHVIDITLVRSSQGRGLTASHASGEASRVGR